MIEPATLLHLDTRELPIEMAAALKAARDSGYDAILACSSKPKVEHFGLPSVIEAPLVNYAAAEAVILDYLHETGKRVAGVIAWTERAVELAARLVAKLGLPGTRPEAAANVRNKARTRRLLNRVAGANPKYAIVRNEQEFQDGLKTVSTPCLLKPAGSAGGRGQFRLYDCSNALQTYREFRAYNAGHSEKYPYYLDIAVMEEMLTGTEHSVSGVVVNRKVVVFAVCDKRVHGGISPPSENATPSCLAPAIRARLIEMARSAVGEMGIDCCGFHVDFMVGEDGPKILEVGGRFGGDCINSHLIPLSQPTLRPYRALLDVAQGIDLFDKDDYSSDASSRAGLRVITPPATGTIVKLEGVEHVPLHLNTRVFTQTHGVGSRMRLAHEEEKAYEIGAVIAQCSLEEDIHGILDEIVGLVTVEVANDAAAAK